MQNTPPIYPREMDCQYAFHSTLDESERFVEDRVPLIRFELSHDSSVIQPVA